MKTLKEIAHEAGVSMTTVSNVINGNEGRVSAATIERIQEIIHREGYIPNQAARSLAQRESRIVAIIVQAAPGENIFRNPYMAEFIGDVTIELQRVGYYPLLRLTDDYRVVERNLLGWNVAGAVLCGAFDRNLQHIKGLNTIPAVLTDSYFPIPNMNYICVDDELGGRIAAQHLIQYGHTRCAFLASSIEESDVEKLRLKGFEEALTHAGLSLPPQHVIDLPDPESDLDMIRDLLHTPDAPTAIFCTADRIAIKLIGTLHELGMRVPEDISIIGFDDLPIARLSHPPLTTLGQDIADKAARTVEILVRHIKDKSLEPEHIQLPVWLVTRGSAGICKQ